MSSGEWWTVGDDPAIFGPVSVEIKTGAVLRHQGDFQFARWGRRVLKPGVVREESLLLLDRDGETIEIDARYVIQVERPHGNLAGKVVLDGVWQRDAMTPMREPAERSVPRLRATREQLARMLHTHGEVDLAERVLSISDTELDRIGALAGYYAWSDEAFAVIGGSMGGVRAGCLATIDVLEGTMRDLHQTRTQSELEQGWPAELSDVELARERSLRLRGTTGRKPSDP